MSPGERAAARVLVHQLPSRVEVYHGFNWLGRNSRGILEEGECDFVLLDRERGMLFVEANGGSLAFEGGQWIRLVRGETRYLNKAPFTQAQRGMREIITFVKQRFARSGGELPFTYGYAVAFPDCRFTGTLPPSIQPELLLDAARLPTASDSIRRAFASFRRPYHRGLDVREVESVRAALYPRYELVPVIWRKIEDQEERLHRLTEEQGRILDILANQSTAAICGVAGSGKTLLALAKAHEAARAGQRTLMPCYNRPLQDWLRTLVPESSGRNPVILNYH